MIHEPGSFFVSSSAKQLSLNMEAVLRQDSWVDRKQSVRILLVAHYFERASRLVSFWSRKRLRAVWEQRLRNESQGRREKWLSFHFSRGQNRKSFPSVFLCSETKRNRLLRGLNRSPFYRRWVYGWTASAFGIKISRIRNDRIHSCYHQVL